MYEQHSAYMHIRFTFLFRRVTENLEGTMETCITKKDEMTSRHRISYARQKSVACVKVLKEKKCHLKILSKNITQI